MKKTRTNEKNELNMSDDEKRGYVLRLRKFLQVPTGYRKSILPHRVYPGQRCPVLVPTK